MTRAYREKLASGHKEQANVSFAVIRIRLPEGLILQGEFNAGRTPRLCLLYSDATDIPSFVNCFLNVCLKEFSLCQGSQWRQFLNG